MIKLLSILKEIYVNGDGEIHEDEEYQVIIEIGEIKDTGEKARRVQILFYDIEEQDFIDISEHPTFHYLENMGVGIWVLNPLRKYKGDEEEYEFTNGIHEYEFTNTPELEIFLKKDLKNKIIK